jgi:HSP20 family protein
MFGLRREIDRLFEDAYGGRGNSERWNPYVNVRESKDAVLLEIELPGVKPEDVNLSVDQDVLTVSGEKRAERREGEEEDRYHLVERTYGSFTRSFTLPSGTDPDQVSADFDSGVLTIKIPRAALPQPRKIEIGARSSREVAAGDRESSRSTGGRSESRSERGRSGEKRAEGMAATSKDESR